MARACHLETVTCILPDSVAGFKGAAMCGPALFVSPSSLSPGGRPVSLHGLDMDCRQSHLRQTPDSLSATAGRVARTAWTSSS